MWFLPAIACMQTEKGTSRSHHTSGNLQISTIRSQILTYGNDVMKSAAGIFLDLGIWSGTLSSMYVSFWTDILNSQISCFTVLTHQHALWLCPQPSTKGGSISNKSICSGAAMMANWGNCRICSENPFTVLFGSLLAEYYAYCSRHKKTPIATRSGSSRAKVGSNQRRSAQQQPLGVHQCLGTDLIIQSNLHPGLNTGYAMICIWLTCHHNTSKQLQKTVAPAFWSHLGLIKSGEKMQALEAQREGFQTPQWRGSQGPQLVGPHSHDIHWCAQFNIIQWISCNIFNKDHQSCARMWSYKYVYIYMSHRKNLGNTKYVLDGHWFMEIDGHF